MPVTERGLIEARDGLSQLLTEAEQGGWPLIRDRSGLRSAVVEWNRLAEMLGPRGPAVDRWLPLADARAQLPRLHRELEQHWIGISRRGREFALADADQLLRRLDQLYRFGTEVIYEPHGGVALWVPELALFGRGSSYDEARTDLLDEVNVYVDEWEQDLRHAPNHRSKEGWVRRLQLLADDESRARALLEG